MLKTISIWDGEINIIGVEDTDGGTWWSNSATQIEIQAANNPAEKAKEICDTQPMRGEWCD